MAVLSELIGLFSCTGYIEGWVFLEEDTVNRKGLASFLMIKCTLCPFMHSVYTSKGAKDNEQLKEVNIRSVYATRRVGVGHKGLQKFCETMNMPPPVAVKSYNKLADKLGHAAEKVSKVSMLDAAMSIKQTEGTEIGISFDGTWQRRGHSSLNSVGTAISVSTGKPSTQKFFRDIASPVQRIQN